MISFVNPFSYYQLKGDSKYRDIDKLFSDGLLLCTLHRIFFRKIARASFDFSSVADFVFEEALHQNARLAIVGATDDENRKAVDIIERKYPGINIVYTSNGYIKRDQLLLESIESVMPDLVILGMGTPHQENYALFLKDNLHNDCLIITCGGFLTQTSIREDYYFPVVKKLGLRWLQRAIMHKHVRKRLLKEYPLFIIRYISENIYHKLIN
ncbi:hypothetical protein A8L45_01670 [Veronia pacifica]|uniref:Glycosyl transferase n=1 Tax=Veronia pacifica TaxID=1080227 RepID=A0A1C3ERV0_9GAMM|nr:hypothetical protein A8L45_01670 [Veronia pacifica]